MTREGIGKTYLSAFDSMDFKRVLFVAHREEILQQAFVSFQNVRKSKDMGFFKGNLKEVDKSVIFASVATLGKKEYLNKEYFAPGAFDYIVVDEFHHVVSNQYQRIVKYFKPKFLLGLTATPERMDGKNIYEICDYNVPFEISLKEAINKGMLVPFHYYGIYDKTDYSSLKLAKGKYAEKDLNAKYLENTDRFDLIYKYYKKYPSKRALGFCCSRLHAEVMAKEFNRRGIPSVAVYCNDQGEFAQDRTLAIRQLREEKIKVIFSVDMFNEGVDIDSLDMVMFLRPTESPIVFLQQLGRGLRLCEGKSYLNVLDFIGNYVKANKTPHLLKGDYGDLRDGGYVPRVYDYPEDCIVDFDMQLIDLFKKMEKKSKTIKQQIQSEYHRVKDVLGKVPTRMELFLNMDDDVYEYCMNHTKENIFRGYMNFLYEMKDVSKEELDVYSGVGKDFLNLIETTAMNKAYKMPILYSIYNDGKIKMNVTDEDVLYAWKHFFDEGTNWKDLSEGITYAEYKKKSDKDHLSNAKRNPIHFLLKSGKGFFVKKENYAISLNDCLQDIIKNPAFIAHFKDIIDYRTIEYYRRRYMRKG